METMWRLIAVILIATMETTGLVFSAGSIFPIFSPGTIVALILCILSVAEKLPKKIALARTKLDILDWRKRSICIATDLLP